MSHGDGVREAGKGDSPRKQQDQKAYEEGWDRIFKRKDSDPNRGKALEEETLKENEND